MERIWSDSGAAVARVRGRRDLVGGLYEPSRAAFSRTGNRVANGTISTDRRYQRLLLKAYYE